MPCFILALAPYSFLLRRWLALSWSLTHVCYVLSFPANLLGGIFSFIGYYCNFSFLDFLVTPIVKGIYMLSYWDYCRTFTSILWFVGVGAKNNHIVRFIISKQWKPYTKFQVFAVNAIGLLCLHWYYGSYAAYKGILIDTEVFTFYL